MIKKIKGYVTKDSMPRINVCIPQEYKKMIDNYVEELFYRNRSEFVRSAIKEKILRETPTFFDDLLKKKILLRQKNE